MVQSRRPPQINLQNYPLKKEKHQSHSEIHWNRSKSLKCNNDNSIHERETSFTLNAASTEDYRTGSRT